MEDVYRGLDTSSRFLHSDELTRQYPEIDIPLPAVLLENESGIAELIHAEDFTRVANPG